MRVIVVIFLWAVLNANAQADDTLSLNSAIERLDQIVSDEKFLSDKWSSSYFIMHKRVYGSKRLSVIDWGRERG
jgi:hypothetical protein